MNLKKLKIGDLIMATYNPRKDLTAKDKEYQKNILNDVKKDNELKQDYILALELQVKELEKIENYKEVIFWSFSRKDYQKTNWWSRTASSNINTQLTIRTANTIRKIANM